jgi:LmbE family N-acetylglucosaminyl deacetylase
MNKILLLFIMACNAFIVSAQLPGTPSAPKTILAIFPHPDDESAIAEVLLKYKNRGYKIQLIVATDGKDGTRVTTIPAGDSLGTIRKEETRCACRILGIEEPIFLGIDRLDTRIGVGKYFAAHKMLLELLKFHIEKINPDIILTFGPDGDTHHAEHIVTGAAVTELLLREGWVDIYPLYYLAWSKAQGHLFNLGYVDEKYFNVKIEYTQEEEHKALTIMPCYVTQFTPQEIQDDYQIKTIDPSNTIYFRKFSITRGMQSGF